MLHKHPTPLSIKGHVFKAMVAIATERNIESYAVLSMMDAVDGGIKEAHQEHIRESEND